MRGHTENEALKFRVEMQIVFVRLEGTRADRAVASQSNQPLQTKRRMYSQQREAKITFLYRFKMAKVSPAIRSYLAANLI